MILLYIIGGLILVGLLRSVYGKFIAKPLDNYLDSIRFNKKYSKHLCTLKIKIRETQFDEIQSDINTLKSEIQSHKADLTNIKKHILSTKLTELEDYLLTRQIADKFLKDNGTD